MSNETILGGRELNAFFQQLPAKVGQNIMRAALRAGANEFKDEIKANIPVASGRLRRSVRVSTRASKGKVMAYVRVGGKKAAHAQLVEFGTRPHRIEPKRGGSLLIGGHPVAGVDHPGAKAQPFARPALDTKTGAAVAAVAAKVRQRLTLEGINTPAPEDT